MYDIRLAPMAGITDIHFRNLTRALGFSGKLYTEMTSCMALQYNNQKTLDMLKIEEQELPLDLQIFGHDTKIMANGAKKALDYIKNNSGEYIAKNIGININMGCPAKKILKNGDGGTLLKDLDNAYKIYETVQNSISNHVSIKTRLGYDTDISNEIINKFNSTEIIMHGRLVIEEYRGKARLDHLSNVIYNGDIKTMEQVAKYKKVAIGRAVLGHPELLAKLEGKEVTLNENEILKLQLDLIKKYYGNSRIGFNLTKKHLLYTLKKEKHIEVVVAKNIAELENLL